MIWKNSASLAGLPQQLEEQGQEATGGSLWKCHFEDGLLDSRSHGRSQSGLNHDKSCV